MDLFDLFNESLREMYPSVFQIGTENLTYNPAIIGYNSAVTTKPIVVLARMDSSDKEWRVLRDWSHASNMDTSEFSSGNAIMIRVALNNGAPIKVLYKTPFTEASAESDDLVSDLGLETYMVDLPFYYMMGYSLPSREIDRGRIETAQAHQRAQDVPAFLNMRTGEWYLARYFDKLREAMMEQVREIRSLAGAGYGS
jgi:hypothetical protein